MQDAPDYYKILGVFPEATTFQIKEAFRRLARQYHPDLHPDDPDAEQRFKEICQAYEVLSDTAQRSAYDRELNPNRSRSQNVGRSSHEFYVRATNKALEKDYRGAVEEYTKAIEQDPHFIEAYLKRGEALFKLGKARETLQDCNRVLDLNPNLPQAYYYQGRARYRLGYTAAAIEAYTQAIYQKPDYAQAYYHRGLANYDLQELAQAFEDLQKASELFEECGDITGYQLARGTLNTINRTKGKLTTAFKANAIAAVKSLLGDAIFAFKLFVLNPVGGLLPAYNSMSQQRAMAVGIIYAGIFGLCLIGGAYTGWQDIFQVSAGKLFLLGFVPFVALIVVSGLARLIARRATGLAGDMFVAGASLLPIGMLALASGISIGLGSSAMIIITVVAYCYAILTLYSGCTQIANLPEKGAALLVPILLLVSSWFSFIAFVVMFL